MWGSGAPRELAGKSHGQSREANEGIVIGTYCSFLARTIFPLANPGEETKKGRQASSRERTIQSFYKLCW